jgi:N-acetylglucosamine kinase-like BadF-type ATPase
VPRLLLGVDGGNTKTVALVATHDGSVVGAARAGPGDIYGAGGPEAALPELERATKAALAEASASAEKVDAAVFCLAGADWPEDYEFLRTELSRILGIPRLEVLNDALGALRAGTSDGVGVAVVCGTGGCIGARSPEGKAWHSSFWAPKTGGWAIGNHALDAVYRAELGVGPATALTEAALEVFAASSVEELLHSFTRRGGRRRFDSSLLAPAVLREASRGEPIAREIIVDQGRLLGDTGAAAARIVGLAGRPYPLVLLGGVLRGEGAGLLRDEIVARVPEGVPVEARFEPAAGALLAAFDAAGVEPDEERLRETFPGPDFFASSPPG